ncbi:hypothetical protein [Streptomyces sp. NPDC050982]|uniref:hypothetical protein n=1 Tax=Streptomyces sp. NPDC050982 TaxID=3154746 RepID=UPI0033C58F31
MTSGVFRVGAAGLLTCALVAGCGVPGGVRVEGAAPTALPWSGTTYVMDYQSVPWDRPESLALTQDTWLSHLRWRQWGGNRAVGTGVSWDMACTSGCTDDGISTYGVTVVLSDPRRRAHAAYYAHVSVSPARGEKTPDWAETGIDDLTVHVPAS